MSEHWTLSVAEIHPMSARGSTETDLPLQKQKGGGAGGGGGWGVAQWHGTQVACVRPWAPAPALEGNQAKQ